MNLKLNIYNKKEIVKTYSTDTYDLMFGTVEDFLNLIEIDKLKTGDNKELVSLVGNAVVKGMPMIKTLLKDVFDGITDDELKNTKLKEITRLLIDIVKFGITEIGIGVDEKN